MFYKRRGGGGVIAVEFLRGGESRASRAGKLSTRGRTVFPAHKLSTISYLPKAVLGSQCVLPFSTRMSLPANQAKEASQESLPANQLEEHSPEPRIVCSDPDIVSAPLSSGWTPHPQPRPHAFLTPVHFRSPTLQ